jgi:phosphatidylserine decarboxylase
MSRSVPPSPFHTGPSRAEPDLPGVGADRAGPDGAATERGPPPVSGGWRLVLALLRRLPQGGLSRLTGWLAERPVPRPLRKAVIGGFARAVAIDRDEAAHPPERFPSVSAYFSRELRPGARSWPGDTGIATSPVDGVLGALGPMREGRLLQAKGIWYTAAELLAERDEAADRFREGCFVTIYLSPRHYHRIHAPVGGTIRAARAVPGALLPVNGPAVSGIPRLFPRNERLVVHLEAVEPAGGVAVVAVGAFNVGRISAAFEPEWNGPDGKGVTNRRSRCRVEERSYRPGLPLERGREIMAFHLGSTVVLLFDGPAVEGRRLHPGLEPGAEIRVGEPLFVRRRSGSG